tara:strand:- start:224 stop:793 length:570 start_codon:yes stop_codon:yes gene_type:complete
MKLCTKCNKEKDSSSPSYCKSCLARRNAEYYQNNKEKINKRNKEQKKEYYQNNKEQILERKKEYYQNNKEQRKEYYQDNKEKALEYEKEYRQNNPHKAREKNRKRRALKQKNIHKPYSEDQVLKIYGSVCHICKEEIDLLAKRSPGVSGWEQGLHLDHVIPISKGGADTLDNVKPAHGLCNIQKSASVL